MNNDSDEPIYTGDPELDHILFVCAHANDWQRLRLGLALSWAVFRSIGHVHHGQRTGIKDVLGSINHVVLPYLWKPALIALAAVLWLITWGRMLGG